MKSLYRSWTLRQVQVIVIYARRAQPSPQVPLNDITILQLKCGNEYNADVQIIDGGYIAVHSIGPQRLREGQTVTMVIYHCFRYSTFSAALQCSMQAIFNSARPISKGYKQQAISNFYHACQSYEVPLLNRRVWIEDLQTFKWHSLRLFHTLLMISRQVRGRQYLRIEVGLFWRGFTNNRSYCTWSTQKIITSTYFFVYLQFLYAIILGHRYLRLCNPSNSPTPSNCKLIAVTRRRSNLLSTR